MDFLQIAAQFGIPVALLVAVLVGLYRLANRSIDEIGKPALARLAKHLDESEQTQRVCVDELKTLRVRQDEHILICRHAAGDSLPHHA